MPSTSRCGVVRTLPKDSLPVLSSNTAISVKVPPISAANRSPVEVEWGLELEAIDFCFRASDVMEMGSMAHGQAILNREQQLNARAADNRRRGVELDAHHLWADRDHAVEQVAKKDHGRDLAGEGVRPARRRPLGGKRHVLGADRQ